MEGVNNCECLIVDKCEKARYANALSIVISIKHI